jgi:hypothetical protein
MSSMLRIRPPPSRNATEYTCCIQRLTGWAPGVAAPEDPSTTSK